jgi:hypothetical protein
LWGWWWLQWWGWRNGAAERIELSDTAGVDPVPVDIALSGSGTVLAQVLTNSRQASGITPTSNVIWADQEAGSVLLSPDGTLIAASNTGLGTNLLKNGSLTTAVNGSPLGWLNNNLLITNIFDYSVPHTGVSPYQHAALYDATGIPVGTSALPELHVIQPLTADSLYSPEQNSIFTVSTGGAAWMSGDASRGQGAVAGGYVVFSSGARVLALSH